MSYKEPFKTPSMRLDHWDGHEKSLALAMHQRGLLRLAHALSNQGEHFVWYICHRLDIGRGSLLAKFCTKQAPKETSDILTKNILDILPIIQH